MTRQTTVQTETLTAALELETETVSRRKMLASFMIVVVVDVVQFIVVVDSLRELVVLI